MEPLNVPYFPKSLIYNEADLEKWNEAYRRVESYFSSLRVENKLLLSSLVLKILGKAGERYVNEPDRSPLELAAEETDRLIVEWFRKILSNPGDEPDDRLSARGRLALMLVESKVPWQPLFLSDARLPQEFITAFRDAYLHADPNFRFTTMRPRPIDLGIVDVATRTMESMGKWRTLFSWTMWVGFTGLLILIFFLTR